MPLHPHCSRLQRPEAAKALQALRINIVWIRIVRNRRVLRELKRRTKGLSRKKKISLCSFYNNTFMRYDAKSCLWICVAIAIHNKRYILVMLQLSYTEFPFAHSHPDDISNVVLQCFRIGVSENWRRPADAREEKLLGSSKLRAARARKCMQGHGFGASGGTG